MLVSSILKCILLAKSHVLVLEQPINEYAMATIETTFNEVFFQGTVVEGKMNSVIIRYPKLQVEAMAYSTKNDNLNALSTRLDAKSEHASIECDISEQAIK
ncbi:MAG: hypothetical protein Q7U04_12780 [Bacteriovorax sp.]|nr:hypothetical protein [Bacteriovorax sp.]